MLTGSNVDHLPDELTELLASMFRDVGARPDDYRPTVIEREPGGRLVIRLERFEAWRRGGSELHVTPVAATVGAWLLLTGQTSDKRS